MLAYSQTTPVHVRRVANSTTVFTSHLAVGSIIYNVENRNLYLIIKATDGAKSLSTLTEFTDYVLFYIEKDQDISRLLGTAAYADISSFVPKTRTLTINGTSFDLSADRTFTVGRVTSVALTAPTGFSVSGSPITSSGTLALSFATGYSLPTTAKQSNWDTAYGWGNHASAGYLLNADLSGIRDTTGQHADTLAQHRVELDALSDTTAQHRVELDALSDTTAQHRVEIDANTESVAQLSIEVDGKQDIRRILGTAAYADIKHFANPSLSNLASTAINTPLLPGTSDGVALGSATKMWSDVFLASGGVINWDNGNVTLTHGNNQLSLSAGDSLLIPIRAYNATTWNNSTRAVAEDAVRDQFVTVQDSVTKHKGWHYTQRDSIAAIYDSLALHRDTLWDHSDRLVALEGGSGSGANTALSNLSNVAVNTSLLPAEDTVKLGSAAKVWLDAYIKTLTLKSAGAEFSRILFVNDTDTVNIRYNGLSLYIGEGAVGSAVSIDAGDGDISIIGDFDLVSGKRVLYGDTKWREGVTGDNYYLSRYSAGLSDWGDVFSFTGSVATINNPSDFSTNITLYKDTTLLSKNIRIPDNVFLGFGDASRYKWRYDDSGGTFSSHLTLTDGSGLNAFISAGGTGVQFYYGGVEKFVTANSGLLPSGNGVQALGYPDKRWSTVYSVGFLGETSAFSTYMAAPLSLLLAVASPPSTPALFGGLFVDSDDDLLYYREPDDGSIHGPIGGGGGSMVYPGAGIALSTGTGWGTSITNASANWNTAYGWGNHATAGYAPLGSVASHTEAISIVNGTAANTAFYLRPHASQTANIIDVRNMANSANLLTFSNVGSLTLGSGVGINEFSSDGTLGGNSDTAVPTEKAVKTYVASISGSSPAGSGTEWQYRNSTAFGAISNTFTSPSNPGIKNGGKLLFGTDSTIVLKWDAGDEVFSLSFYDQYTFLSSSASSTTIYHADGNTGLTLYEDYIYQDSTYFFDGIRVLGSVDIAELASDPPTPASGYGRLYFDTSGNLWYKNDAGSERQISYTTSAPEPSPMMPSIDYEQIANDWATGLRYSTRMIEFRDREYRFTEMVYDRGLLVSVSPGKWQRMNLIQKMIYR